MKKFLFLALLLLSCKEDPKPEPKIVVRENPPLPVPVATNPFDKPAPAPAHVPFQVPHWEQAGGEFKMNGEWSLWTWRDAANNNTCYFYNIVNNGALIGHGMSCVKE